MSTHQFVVMVSSSVAYVCGMAAVKPLFTFSVCVSHSQLAEVSCFDDVALLYHPLKQCNSIVIAFGLRLTLRSSTAEGRMLLNGENRLYKPWMSLCRFLVEGSLPPHPHTFLEIYTQAHTFPTPNYMTQATGLE